MSAIVSRLNTREILLFGFLVVFSVIVGLVSPAFLTERNWVYILDATAVTGIVALGEMLVILSGGIDISVGAVAVATALVLGTLIGFMGVPPVFALAAALLVGALLGALNGLLVGYMRIPAIIVTLATLRIYRGGLEILTPGQHIPPITDSVPFLAFAKVGPVPLQVFVFFAMALIVGIFLAYTRLGRSIYAVGGNPAASFVAGVNLKWVQLATYTLCGLITTVGMIVYFARASFIERYSFSGIEFLCIAIVVMGGTSITGGAGKVVGSVIGAILLYAIYNGMLIAQIDPAWQSAVTGALILIAVSLEGLGERGGHD
jgi:ribose/xylose/arabinose/galactoside ABC-type transport system permease subunit